MRRPVLHMLRDPTLYVAVRFIVSLADSLGQPWAGDQHE